MVRQNSWKSLQAPLVARELARRLHRLETLEHSLRAHTAGGHEQVIRVSVVGQVKSGKSTLVNALLGVFGVMPTDINPWTAVSTGVRTGPETGPDRMVFEFVDKMRNAAADQGVGTKTVDSGAEVARLGRETAPSSPRLDDSYFITSSFGLIGPGLRSGNEAARLCGSSAEFASVSRDILERYVCVGGVGDTTESPCYSSIVESAEVYLDRDRFAVPTILLDTPGTNDPGLAKSRLDHVMSSSDVVIMVASGQQAMGPSDRELLELLSETHRGRIIIFVNRMDQLSMSAVDVARLQERVSSLIDRVSPGVAVPLVLGSARAAELTWADESLLQSELERTHWQHYLGLDDDACGPISTVGRSQLFARSGLAELATRLSEVMLTGPGASILSKRSSELLEFASRELQAMSLPVPKDSENVTGAGPNLARLADKLGEITHALVRQMSAKLAAEIETAADEQLLNFMSQSAKVRSGATNVDLGPTKARIESRFVTEHETLSQKVAEAQRSIATEFLASVASGMGAAEADLTLLPAPVDPDPCLAPILAIRPETSTSWRRFWQRSNRTAEQAQGFAAEVRKGLENSVADLCSDSLSACKEANRAFVEALNDFRPSADRKTDPATQDRQNQLRAVSDALADLKRVWEP